MELHDVWFVLIAVLWTGYFFLEGFDFGVGVLTKLLARNRPEKRVLINTIGPVWDGHEVWLRWAGGGARRSSRTSTTPAASWICSTCTRCWAVWSRCRCSPSTGRCSSGSRPSGR